MTNTSSEMEYSTASQFSELEFNSIERTPLYFGSQKSPLYGCYHFSPNVKQQDKCVLICPPLGLDYMNSHRSLRYIADYFSLAGIPSLRFDYHGTGDSVAANYNENRVPNWLKSIEIAHDEIKKITGYSKVGLFGFRLGATLSCLFAQNNPIDFLVLWSPIDKGKRFIREIKTLQKTSNVKVDYESNILEAGGTVYWPETELAINEIDLFKISVKAKNLLIIPRDDLAVKQKLIEHFNSKNIVCSQLELKGSHDMLIDAHQTVVPHSSISKIMEWSVTLNNEHLITTPPEHKQSIKYYYQSSCQFKLSNKDPEGSAQTETCINESFHWYSKSEKRFSIMTFCPTQLKEELPIVILANSGTNHRVGPSRLYVQVARQLAHIGYRVFRIDLPGIGDSIISNRTDENIEYMENGSQEIISLIHSIKREYADSKFVIGGLCSGAYFSFHTALNYTDNDISEIFMINPLTFYWETGMTSETSPVRNFSAWNWYKSAAKNPQSWKKIFTGNVDYLYLIRTIITRITMKFVIEFRTLFDFVKYKLTHQKSNRRIIKDLANDLKYISEKGINIHFLFSKSDPGYDLLTTLGGSTAKNMIKNNDIKLAFVNNADHTFSKHIPRKEAISYIYRYSKKQAEKLKK